MPTTNDNHIEAKLVDFSTDVFLNAEETYLTIYIAKFQAMLAFHFFFLFPITFSPYKYICSYNKQSYSKLSESFIDP